VAGGFLVAASAAGVFAVARGDDGPTASYAVVTEDVGAGEQLGPDRLALVPVDLAPAQRRVSFADLEVLNGATALTPMAAGQLVASSDVARPDGAPALAQISLPVDPASALNGDANLLGAGDLVDVIVTYTTGGDPITSTVTRDAPVVRVFRPDESVGGAGSVIVVLAVPPTDLEPVAQAAAAGKVTLARTTGVAR
jgi:Flp pilus assembly protein CpaB